jgi:hypothetical protein
MERGTTMVFLLRKGWGSNLGWQATIEKMTWNSVELDRTNYILVLNNHTAGWVMAHVCFNQAPSAHHLMC